MITWCWSFNGLELKSLRSQAILCYRLLIAVHLHSCTQDPACTLNTWWLCHESHPLSTAAPLFPNLRQFPHGRRFKQWTAALIKVHCFNLRLTNYWYLKFLLLAIASHIPSEMTHTVCPFAYSSVFSFTDLLFSPSLPTTLGGTRCSHRPPSATSACSPFSLRPNQQTPQGHIGQCWPWQLPNDRGQDLRLSFGRRILFYPQSRMWSSCDASGAYLILPTVARESTPPRLCLCGWGRSKPGMCGMNVACVQLFFSFVHNRKEYPCALVDWFSTWVDRMTVRRDVEGLSRHLTRSTFVFGYSSWYSHEIIF